MTAIEFDVLGTPAPQGSKRAFVNRHTGLAQIVDDNPAPLRTWRNDVVNAASAAIDEARFNEPLKGPVAVRVTFRLARPPSAPKSRRYPSVRPDVDKLARGVLDALRTAGAYRDDAQVVQALISKVYCTNGELPGATIRVIAVD